MLALKYLRNVKSVFYIFGLDAFHWSSHNVGGIATPVARTACEACAESLLRIRATNSIYVFQGWRFVPLAFDEPDNFGTFVSSPYIASDRSVPPVTPNRFEAIIFSVRSPWSIIDRIVVYAVGTLGPRA